MKNKPIKAIIPFMLIASMLLSMRCLGQDIEFQDFHMPDSVDYQSEFEIEGKLFNNGPADFSGEVTMLFYVDTVLTPPSLPPSNFTFSQNNSFSGGPILVGQFVEYQVELDASPSFFNFFAAKDHIVIIWPLIDGEPSSNPNAIYIDTIYVRDISVSSEELTALENITEDQDLKIFPNPSYGGYFTVALPAFEDSYQQIIITDILGQNIWAEEIGSRTSVQIDLSRATGGVYFVTIFGKDMQVSNSGKILLMD